MNIKSNKYIFSWAHLVTFIVIIFTFTSCSISKKLQGGKLLVENEIDIFSATSNAQKSKLQKELSKLLKQKPNGTLIGFPKEYLGETPVIFDATISEKTAENFQNYLRNRKGYYKAEVHVDSIFDGRYATAKYSVTTGKRYKIGSITYHSDDNKIVNEIKKLQDNSLLKVGAPINQSTFYNELNRLALELQNNGYANFTSKYFKIRGDKNVKGIDIDIFIEVLTPQGDSSHVQYTVGDIEIYSDHHRNQQDSLLANSIFDRKIFKRQSSKFIVHPTTINRMTFLEKGKLYTRKNLSKTFRKLSGLGVYKFASIQPEVDAIQDSIINYKIFLNPHDHKWFAEFGTELFYSNINQNANQLLGTNFSSQFNNRNLFRGAEQFTIGQDIGVEFQIPSFKINTFNTSFNANLAIPKQVDLLYEGRFLKNIGILTQKEYQRFKDETTTNIGLRLGYSTTTNLFTIFSSSASFSYDYKRSENTRFIITPIGIDLNRYRLKEKFQRDNKDNQFLLNTFENNLITGFLLKGVSFLKNTPANSLGFSQALIISGEISGWEVSLLNSLYNTVANKSDRWNINGSVFAQYARFEIDQRWYKKISSKSTLALRTYGGIIVPFGKDEFAPYVRQFNVGGPNSIRAWDQRELGPGGNATTLEKPVPNQIFYQQGDVKFEFNVEYRFPLFWLIEGGLFVDGGNVWNLKNDIRRPNSQINTNFYKQIALGAGYGIRFDFDFFIIRFDLGYKLRNPYNEDDIQEILQPYVENKSIDGYWYNWNGIKRQGFGNFQVAINYPF